MSLTRTFAPLLGLGAASLALFSPLTAAAQNLFVATSNPGSITEFTSTAGVLSPTGTNFATLSAPFGVAFDSAGDLFASNPFGQTVTEFPSVGGAPSTTGATNFTNGLNLPIGLAFDKAGNLYVANESSASKITEYAYNSITSTLSTTGATFAQEIANADPQNLAFDQSGDLFVTNFNNTIEKYTFNSGTNTLSNVGSIFATEAANSRPFGLAFDKAGNLYVANNGSAGNNIVLFTYNGGTNTLSNSSTVFANTTTTPSLASPSGLAFDQSGNLYASESQGGDLTEFLNVGGTTLSPTGVAFSSGLGHPQDLVFLSLPAANGPSAVPEPSTWAAFALTGLGVAGLMARARRPTPAR